jgi:hypothetical protein
MLLALFALDTHKIYATLHHNHMPFISFASRVDNNFNLIHCDLWTSQIFSISRCKYYLSILDDRSHYVWTFPLLVKSETFHIVNFCPFISTQFGRTIKAGQCDNSRAFFASSEVILWMSCPYTSPQNGKVERALRTIIKMNCSLLF